MQKSKLTAYLLWFFLGWLGAHKFYVGKTGMGIVYIFTGGLFGIGLLIDLFTLGNQVDLYNALLAGGGNQQQNVVVNVNTAADPASTKVSAEKEILKLADESPQLTLRDIVSRTNLELDEAESALRKMCEKGLVREVVDTEGRTLYDCT
jgi:TM2 domain-containing membrane protein YozV